MAGTEDTVYIKIFNNSGHFGILFGAIPFKNVGGGAEINSKCGYRGVDDYSKCANRGVQF